MVRKAGRDFDSKLSFQCLGSVLLIQNDQVAGFIFHTFYLQVLIQVASMVSNETGKASNVDNSPIWSFINVDVLSEMSMLRILNSMHFYID